MALKHAFYGACCYVEVLVFFDEINAANCMALFKTIIIDRNLAVEGWLFFFGFSVCFFPLKGWGFLWNWEIVENSCMLSCFFFFLIFGALMQAGKMRLDRLAIKFKAHLLQFVDSNHVPCPGETTQWLMNVVYRVMLLATVWGKFWLMYLDIPCKSRMP